MRNFSDKLDNTAPSASGILTAAEDNVRFKELENAVLTAGIALDGPTGPDAGGLFMLAEAIARYASGGIVCQDTGAADAHVLGAVGGFILPKAYFNRMMIIWYPAGTNTGTATVNVNGIGIKQIRNSVGDVLVAGDIAANTLTMALYDPAANSGAGAFKLSPWSMPMRSVGDGVKIYEGIGVGRHKIRSLMAGTNVTIDLVESPGGSGEYKVRIASSGGGGGGTLTDGDKGDIVVTSSAAVWTIDTNVVDNTKLATMPGNTIKARLGSIGDAQDLTGTQVASILPDAASGTKGLTTPDGNSAHFLNGLGSYTTPPSTFATYANIGCYTIVDSPTHNLSSLVGTSKNSTGSGSWLADNVITLPAGVWQLTGAWGVITGAGGGSSGSVYAYFGLFLRIA